MLTAKQWTRAAIVYAFTRPQQGKRTSDGAVEGLTYVEFARLDIAGLTSDNAVSRYRRIWQNAIDAGLAEPAEPGVMADPEAVCGPHDVRPPPRPNRRRAAPFRLAL